MLNFYVKCRCQVKIYNVVNHEKLPLLFWTLSLRFNARKLMENEI